MSKKILASLLELWRARRDLCITLILFAAAMALFATDWFRELQYDGVSTVGAERVLRGEIPYRDFWTMYAPGHFYLLALVFLVFGTHLLAEVVAASVISAAAACLCYWVALRIVNRRGGALLCAAVFAAAIYHHGYFRRLGSYPTGIFLVFLCLLLVLIFQETNRLKYLAAAGATLGAAIIFKHDVGAYTAIAVVVGLWVHGLVSRPPTVLRSCMTQTIVFAFAATAIVAPVLAYFVIVAGPDIYQDLVVFPGGDFRFSRGEYFPTLIPFGLRQDSLLRTLMAAVNYWNLIFPCLLLLLGYIAMGMATARNRALHVSWGAILSTAFLFHYSAAHVQINTHVITMSVYGTMLGVMFYSYARGTEWGALPPFKRMTAAFLTVWFVAMLAVPGYRALRKRSAAAPEWIGQTTPLGIDKVAGFKVHSQTARHLTELTDFVKASVPPGEPIFIGLHRHDVVIIGDKMLYFLLDRPSATRYQELHPAITDTAPVQREIIDDLINKNVRLIVRKYIFDDVALDRMKTSFLLNMPHVGATLLDEFLSERYERVREIGPYEVWQLKEPGEE